MNWFWKWLYGDAFALTIDKDNALLAEVTKLRAELVQHDAWMKASMENILTKLEGKPKPGSLSWGPAVVPDDFETAQRRNLAALEELNGVPIKKR